MYNRESGENPLQPPLLYTATKPNSTGVIAGKEGGERPVSQETCLRLKVLRREGNTYAIFWHMDFITKPSLEVRAFNCIKLYIYP
ncbi:hypothetical protein OXPF_30510 [Oxobacter pfennigii]|uniref:Uncharacterized protein n=1 Tax=Oxobacter pfennigii TaxID=36849 RepID=A0A0P8WM72_9CLOT|nr:hypothetical protein OXPF_30510 [Oxobacter pfennigii]